MQNFIDSFFAFIKNINFIKTFKRFFTALNFVIYFVLLLGLILSIYNKELSNVLNYQWWTMFLVLEIWFNTVITRKSEIGED